MIQIYAVQSRGGLCERFEEISLSLAEYSRFFAASRLGLADPSTDTTLRLVSLGFGWIIESSGAIEPLVA